MAMTSADYLKRPYLRTIVSDEDGSFRAEIIEFPGCIATGDTATEALEALEDVAASWVEGMLASGQDIPAPSNLKVRWVVNRPGWLCPGAPE